MDGCNVVEAEEGPSHDVADRHHQQQEEEEEEEGEDGEEVCSRTLHIAGIGPRLGSSLEEILVFLRGFGALDEGAEELGGEEEPLEVITQEGDHGEGGHVSSAPTTTSAKITNHDRRRRWEKGILLIPGQAFILARYMDQAEARKAMEALSQSTYKSRPVTVNFFKPRQRSKEGSAASSGPLCPSATAGVHVPGLRVVEEVVTSQEEEDLLRSVEGQEEQAEDPVLRRRVLHFGHVFDYKTRKVDFSRQAPEIPSLFRPLLDRFLRLGLVSSAPDQITVNDYLPGQGIAGHVETHSAFKDVLLSLSLGSGCVMDFRHPDDVGRKALLLPPRSLLILEGEARYVWSHGIAYRKFDKVGQCGGVVVTNEQVDGKMVARGRRVSLTFRRVLPSQVCFCAFPSACDTTDSDRQAALGKIRQQHTLAEAVVPTLVEKDHVHAVYDEIAPHWNHTRARRKVHWPRVKEFLEGLPPHSLIADVGCGDGKYLDLNDFKNPTCLAIGCDRSQRLLELCRSQGQLPHQVFACDVLKVPLRSHAFDAVVCVAVLHHMSTEEHRLQVLREVARLLKLNGQAIVLVWALEQENESRRRFEEQDTLVPWKMNIRYIGGTSDGGARGGAGERKKPEAIEDAGRILVFNRYCHLYREWELEGLLERLAPLYEFEILRRGFDKGNWYVTIRKTTDRGL